MGYRGRNGRYCSYENTGLKGIVDRSLVGFMDKDLYKNVPRSLIFIPNLKDQVMESLWTEGWRGETWFYKDHRILFSWKSWLEAFPEAIFILVRRNEIAIMESCLATTYVRRKVGLQSKLGWILWIRKYLARIWEIEKETTRWREIWPASFICSSNCDSVKGLIEELGLNWNSEDYDKVVHPNLWRPK